MNVTALRKLRMKARALTDNLPEHRVLFAAFRERRKRASFVEKFIK